MTTPGENLAQFLVFPDLKIKGYTIHKRRGWLYMDVESDQALQCCYRCGRQAEAIYDHRRVRLKDAPVRDRRVCMSVLKRRFYCKACKKPFTESLPSVFRGCRITERLRRHVLYLCRHFTNLHAVGRATGVSSSTVFRSFYTQLKVEKYRHLNYPLPAKIGIDEHGFSKLHYGNFRQGTLYSTVLTDFKGSRLYQVFPTKSPRILFEFMSKLEGLENVKEVVIDYSQGYRNLVYALFPNARITTDKWHTLNLLSPALNRRRKLLAGDRRSNPIGKLLLKNPTRLDFFKRSLVQKWVSQHQELNLIYCFRARLFSFYQTRGYDRAQRALERILEDLKAHDHIKELKALRATLSAWKMEILNYFLSGLTNAMTEGFNNKAKLVKRMAYGYKNHQNYELRLLNACFKS